MSDDGERNFDCGKYGWLSIEQGLESLLEAKLAFSGRCEEGKDEEDDTEDANAGLKMYDVLTCGYVFWGCGTFCGR